MDLIQISTMLNNVIIPNCFGGSLGVTIAEDLSNIAELGTHVSNLDDDDLKNFQKEYVTGVVENWMESRKYIPETYGIFMDEIEYGGAVQRIRARLEKAIDSDILSLSNANTALSPVDYNDGKFYGPVIDAKVYKDEITKAVRHSVPLEQTRKSFTRAIDVSKYNAMVEANVDNTISFEMNALAKGIFRKLADVCNSSRKIQLMTLYNTTFGYTSGDAGYIDLTNWNQSASFKLWCESVIIRLKKSITEFNVKYGDGTCECFTPPEDVRVLLLEEFGTALDFVQSSVYHKELTDVGEYRTIQYWQNGSTDLMPQISATSVHDKIKVDDTVDYVIGPVVGFVYDKFTCGLTERAIKTTSDYFAKGDFVTYYNHVAYSSWINQSNCAIMLTLE